MGAWIWTNRERFQLDVLGASGAVAAAVAAAADADKPIVVNEETLMQSLPDGFSQVDEFVSLCSSEKGGGVSTGVNSALASLKDTQPDMRFTCSYTCLLYTSPSPRDS